MANAEEVDLKQLSKTALDCFLFNYDTIFKKYIEKEIKGKRDGVIFDQSMITKDINRATCVTLEDKVDLLYSESITANSYGPLNAISEEAEAKNNALSFNSSESSLAVKSSISESNSHQKEESELLQGSTILDESDIPPESEPKMPIRSIMTASELGLDKILSKSPLKHTVTESTLDPITPTQSSDHALIDIDHMSSESIKADGKMTDTMDINDEKNAKSYKVRSGIAEHPQTVLIEENKFDPVSNIMIVIRNPANEIIYTFYEPNREAQAQDYLHMGYIHGKEENIGYLSKQDTLKNIEPKYPFSSLNTQAEFGEKTGDDF